MPAAVWFVGALFIFLALAAGWRGRDLWPFSHYPMFSSLRSLDDVVVFRIAIEDASGRVDWWRPRFFRMQDRLAVRFAELMRRPAEERASSPDLLALLVQTRSLLLADLPGAADSAALLFVRRRVERRSGTFVPIDEVMARVPVSGSVVRS